MPAAHTKGKTAMESTDDYNAWQKWKRIGKIDYFNRWIERHMPTGKYTLKFRCVGLTIQGLPIWAFVEARR